jgi:hypothetical protein
MINELLKEKISPKAEQKTIEDAKARFNKADEILNLEKNDANLPVVHKKMIRKTFTMPEEIFDLINKIKDRSLDYRIVLSDSEIIRLGIQTLGELDETSFLKKVKEIPRVPLGKPKKNV